MVNHTKCSFLRIKFLNCCVFICRIFAGPQNLWPHVREVLSTGRPEAWWHSDPWCDPWCDPWTTQVCHSVSLGLPFRTGPRHPDLSRGVAHPAPHRAPRPAAEDSAVLCLHQMWQSVLGRLSLWPRPVLVSGGLPHNGWGQWLSCRALYSDTARLTDEEVLMFTWKTSRKIHQIAARIIDWLKEDSQLRCDTSKMFELDQLKHLTSYLYHRYLVK